MKKDSKGIKRENKPTQKVFLIQRRKNLDSAYNNALSQESVITKSAFAFFHDFLSDIARHFAIMVKLHRVSPTPLSG